MTKCTRNFYEEPVNIRGTKLVAARNFYEEPVNIRGTKLVAAENGYEEVINEIKAANANGKKAAVVGGGPAGMAAAYFLGRRYEACCSRKRL